MSLQMSRFHWHRVFQAMMGETLADAVRRLRLVRSANALLTDAQPIREVAARHGYDDISSFTRAFTSAHGLSPAAFRRRGIGIAEEVPRRPADPNMFDVTIHDLPPARAASMLQSCSHADLSGAFQSLGATLAAVNW